MLFIIFILFIIYLLNINKEIHQQTEAMLFLRLEARYSPSSSLIFFFDLCLIDNLKVLTSLPTCNNISLLSLYPGGNIYVYENINEKKCLRNFLCWAQHYKIQLLGQGEMVQ